jgi:hypothetical protein
MNINFQKMIPLPSQFDIHGRTPEKRRSDPEVSFDKNSSRSMDSTGVSKLLTETHEKVNLDKESPKSVHSPASRLPVRIPSAFKEGRGLTRSPSADLKSSSTDLKSSKVDLKSNAVKLSKSELNQVQSASDPNLHSNGSNSNLKSNIVSDKPIKPDTNKIASKTLDTDMKKVQDNIDPQLQRYTDMVKKNKDEYEEELENSVQSIDKDLR